MPDQQVSSTDGSTGNGGSGQPATQVTPVTNPPVNAAQTNVLPTNTNQQQQQQAPDIAALVAQWEQRNRNLMSEKDKFANERNQAIAAQVSMQEELTRIQTEAQATLVTAAQAAQTALDRAKTLEQDNLRLQRENMRSQLFREKPHLAEYGDFLPQTNDAAELKTAADRLEQIRQADIDRSKTQFAPSAPPLFPAVPGAPTLTATSAQNPLATAPQGVPGQPNLMNLYAGRQTMAPVTVGAASPTAMSPYGAQGDPLQAITQLYAQAKASGKAEDMQRAHEQAVLLGNAAVQQQLTR